MKIYICTNTRPAGQPSCGGRGSKALLLKLQAEIVARQIDCEAIASVCMGHCDKGPNIKVSGQSFHHGVGPADGLAILDDLA
ncbi:MAG: NADH:ubiquinone oxidoreductase subunit E [Candidatus Azotimanducaceae bacterium]